MQIRSEVAAALAVASMLACAGTPGEAGAQGGYRWDGSPTDRPETASSGAFSVSQLSTPAPDRLMADWLTPILEVPIVLATETPRNKPLVTFIAFKGCRGDAAGNCNVTVDYEMLDPKGAVYDLTKGAAVWVGHPAPGADAIELSSSGYGVVFEDKDALGAYLLRATITDHIAGITLRTQQTLVATAD